MINQERDNIEIGATVEVVLTTRFAPCISSVSCSSCTAFGFTGHHLKMDQPTGKLTRGIVKRILTNSRFHPHGIKVELTDGQVGRVQNILN